MHGTTVYHHFEPPCGLGSVADPRIAEAGAAQFHFGATSADRHT